MAFGSCLLFLVLIVITSVSLLCHFFYLCCHTSNNNPSEYNQKSSPLQETAAQFLTKWCHHWYTFIIQHFDLGSYKSFKAVSEAVMEKKIAKEINIMVYVFLPTFCHSFCRWGKSQAFFVFQITCYHLILYGPCSFIPKIFQWVKKSLGLCQSSFLNKMQSTFSNFKLEIIQFCP